MAVKGCDFNLYVKCSNFKCWYKWINYFAFKGTRCFSEQDTLPVLLSTGWFQDRIRAWMHNRTKINWVPYGTVCPLVKYRQNQTSVSFSVYHSVSQCVSSSVSTFSLSISFSICVSLCSFCLSVCLFLSLCVLSLSHSLCVYPFPLISIH